MDLQFVTSSFSLGWTDFRGLKHMKTPKEMTSLSGKTHMCSMVNVPFAEFTGLIIQFIRLIINVLELLKSLLQVFQRVSDHRPDAVIQKCWLNFEAFNVDSCFGLRNPLKFIVVFTQWEEKMDSIFLILIIPRISIQKAVEWKTGREKCKNTVRQNRNLGSYYLVCIRGC